MDKLKPCPFCGNEAERTEPGWSNLYQKKLYGVHCIDAGCVAFDTVPHFFEQKDADESWNRRLAPENKATELPRCDRCEHCTHAPSKKADGFTHYCDLSGRDVGQSHFGHNSPRVCPLRTHENKLLTVERLKQMDGDKICIHYIGHCTGFYEDEIAPYYGDKEQYIQRYNGMLRACDLPLKYYGIEWLAYALKPDQEAHYEKD